MSSVRVKIVVLLVVLSVLAAFHFSILSQTVTDSITASTLPADALIAPTNSTRSALDNKEQSLRSNSETDSSKSSLVFPLKNDKTIPWSTNVHRLWLDPNTTEKPPAQLLLTNFGWNGDDREQGLKYIRTKRSRELLQGVLNHPWFHPTAWEDYTSHRVPIDNHTRYYVFLDVETCFERNYPVYASGGLDTNSDRLYGRGTFKGIRRHCQAMMQAFKSPVLKAPAGTKIIYWDCAGNGPLNCGSRGETKSPRVALASISAHSSQHIRQIDQGLPPPAPRATELTEQQLRDIDTCNETSRPYLLTFAGRDKRELRHRLFDLHNDKDVIIQEKPRGFNMPEFVGKQQNYSYVGLLEQSKFAAVPRGDNLFSYRFTEAMSAGAIPVVYADQWVLPFRKNLIDWGDCCAVIIPEGRVKRTLWILNNISNQKRCEMRRNGKEVYRRYMKTGEGVVAGIIEGLELSAMGIPRTNVSAWRVS